MRPDQCPSCGSDKCENAPASVERMRAKLDRMDAERRLNRMFLGTLLVVGASCVTALVVSGNWRVVVAWLARVSY